MQAVYWDLLPPICIRVTGCLPGHAPTTSYGSVLGSVHFVRATFTCSVMVCNIPIILTLIVALWIQQCKRPNFTLCFFLALTGFLSINQSQPSRFWKVVPLVYLKCLLPLTARHYGDGWNTKDGKLYLSILGAFRLDRVTVFANTYH